jgi:acetyl-CoA carboxylase carboxyl transferase subunit beta
MPTDGWFTKKARHSAVSASAAIPDGVATKCARCGKIIFTVDFEKSLKVCTDCGYHHRLSAAERIAITVDEGSFTPLWGDLKSKDVLAFPEYAAKLAKGRQVTGAEDGFHVGRAAIDGIPVILGVTDFFFMGGSMGSVSGEKITRAMEEGASTRTPVVIFTASGGARMQEGLISLMQMAKTSAAAARLADARVPYIVVLTDPTTGGVLASFATLGDITLAEPGATIGFAGARVAATTSVQKPPADYQTSEWQLAHGQVDQVVQRKDLVKTLSSLLTLLGTRPAHEIVRSPGTTMGRVEVGVG